MYNFISSKQKLLKTIVLTWNISTVISEFLILITWINRVFASSNLATKSIIPAKTFKIEKETFEAWETKIKTESSFTRSIFMKAAFSVSNFSFFFLFLWFWDKYAVKEKQYNYLQKLFSEHGQFAS